MPQLMPLNWMFSMFMMFFLLVICYFLYYFNMKMELNVLSLGLVDDEYGWMW